MMRAPAPTSMMAMQVSPVAIYGDGSDGEEEAAAPLAKEAKRKTARIRVADGADVRKPSPVAMDATLPDKSGRSASMGDAFSQSSSSRVGFLRKLLPWCVAWGTRVGGG